MSTKTKTSEKMETALAFLSGRPKTAYELGCQLYPEMVGKRDTRLIARQVHGTLRALMRRGLVVEARAADTRKRYYAVESMPVS